MQGIHPSRVTSGSAPDAWRASAVIASHIRILRESLAEILEHDELVLVVGLAADIEEALAHTRNLQPDIVLLDTALPHGLVLVGRIRDSAPSVRVVAFGVADTEDDVIAWAEAGVAGYVPRDVALGDFATVVHEIVRGEQTCSARVSACLVRRLAEVAAFMNGLRRASAIPALSGRENQIVELINAGLSNKEIARRLNISVATSKSHVHNVLAKLGVRGRREVALLMRHRDSDPFPASPRALPGADQASTHGHRDCAGAS